jgi:[ribosomal protein S5]-alanine N-acetyltransferase
MLDLNQVLTMRVLETERLILRWLTLEDSKFIFDLVNDPLWLRFIGDKGVRTLDDARNYILNNPIAMYERLGFGLYLVEPKDESVSIGICGLIKRDSLEDVDIGFAFLPEFRGKGYAYESASAMVSYGRKTFGLNRIVAITSLDNHDSAKLLEKLGFSFERIVKLSDNSERACLFASEV